MWRAVALEVFRRWGFYVRRIQPPATAYRPLGHLHGFLRDLQARGFQVSTLFDVGASDGTWARVARRVYADATLVLIEPRPTMKPALDALCRDDRGCRYVGRAAGRAPGTCTLVDRDTSSTLLDIADTSSPRVQVPVTTLDEIALEHGMPDLVKIDVEGYEIEVLEGAQSLFGRTEAFILEAALFEFDPDRPMLHDIVAYMTKHDYWLYDVAGFLRRPLDGALGLIDLCFARRHGTLRRDERRWQNVG